MDVRKLAKDHWDYIERLLKMHGEERYVLTVAGFHYIEAFVHGWKHALEYSGTHVPTLPVTDDEDHYWSEYVSCHPQNEVKSND